MARYTYATGYKSREAADLALVDMLSGDEISEAERPQIVAYDAWLKPAAGQAIATARRFAITLCDN